MAKIHDRFRTLKIKGYPEYRIVLDEKYRRVVFWSRRVSKFNPGGEWRELTQYKMGTYLNVWMIRNGVGKSELVHNLVCRAFYGEPEAYQTRRGTTRKQEVRHGTRGQLDNYPDNLCWGTRGENARDMIRDEVVPKGVEHGMAKLNDNDVREIRRRYAEGGIFQYQLAEQFHVRQATISLIVRREAWKHIK